MVILHDVTQDDRSHRGGRCGPDEMASSDVWRPAVRRSRRSRPSASRRAGRRSHGAQTLSRLEFASVLDKEI